MNGFSELLQEMKVSWELNIESKTLSYEHPQFGLLSYFAEEEWICDNVNTMTLLKKGSLPEGVLPEKVCVAAAFDGACKAKYSLQCYEDPTENGPCCDPCKGGIPNMGLAWFCTGIKRLIDAGGWNTGVFDTSTDDPHIPVTGSCSSGRPIFVTDAGIRQYADGTDNFPNTVYFGDNTPRWARAVVCCTGGEWNVDIYCCEADANNELHYENIKLCSTEAFTHECCPLKFQEKSSVPVCCTCPQLPPVSECCPTADYPELVVTGVWNNSCNPAGMADGSVLDVTVVCVAACNNTDAGQASWQGSQVTPGGPGNNYRDITTTIVLRCGGDLANDARNDLPTGTWSMAMAVSDTAGTGLFDTCFGGAYYFTPTKNEVNCPALLLNFLPPACSEDYSTPDCIFLTDVTVTG